jgi:hypothetical protein
MTHTLSPIEQITYSTVRIECVLQGRAVSTGTGFFCRLLQKEGRFAPVIVTNRQVVLGARRGRLHLCLPEATVRPVAAKHHTIVLEDFQARWLPHPEPAVELCVMPVAELLGDVRQQNSLALQMIDFSLIPTVDDLAELGAAEEVIVVGYPNGIWDSVNNRPVVRKGITATEPALRYLGRPEFLVDLAWLPGSSGSPVLLWNIGEHTTREGERVGRSRVRLLGVLSTSPGRRAAAEVAFGNGPGDPLTAIPFMPDLFGVAINARKLLEFEPILEALAARGQQRWSW